MKLLIELFEIARDEALIAESKTYSNKPEEPAEQSGPTSKKVNDVLRGRKGGRMKSAVDYSRAKAKRQAREGWDG